MRPLLSLCLALLLVTPGVVRAQEALEVETVVFRVDFLSLQPEAYYASAHPALGSPPPDGYRSVVNLHYDFEEPSDFGYLEVHSALTGQRVVHASTVWAGSGQFEFPANGSTDFGEPGPPVAADTVAAVLSFGYGSAAEAQAAWDAVAGTEPARALAVEGPVEVVVFEHFYTEGVADPSTAEWLVVAYTRPDVRDLAVVDVAWPGPLVTDGHPFEPEVRLHNFGSEADSGRLVLEVGGSIVYEGPLALGSGETAEVVLPPLVLDGDATLTFRFFPADPQADDAPGNNAQERSVETTPLPVFRPVSSYFSRGDVPLNGFPLDFDGDGDVDLVTSRTGLWEQQDDGAFVEITPTDLTLPPHPRHALAGDFTGDSVSDLLLVYFENPPVLLQGNGGGSFADITTEAGLADVIGQYRAEAADFDGDRDLDLVFQSQGREPILLNDGSGHFVESMRLNDEAATQDVRVADLDRDGDADIVLANSNAPSAVFVNDGAAGFTRAFGLWGSVGGRAVLPFDYDGDGDADLLFSRPGAASSVLLRNNGDLRFSSVSVPALEIPSFSADAADFDGDGRLDVVLNNYETVTLLVQESPHRFVDHTEVLVGFEEAMSSTTRAHLVDLDGDGDVDLYLPTVYFENQGAPGLGTASAPEPERERVHLAVYPNPAIGFATAAFHLQREDHVALRVFDVLGREVATLSDARRPAGRTEVQLPVASLPNGVYFVRLEAGGRTETRPITVLR
ncbi:MAG: T9SS type A sorting domain-containing protein [Rhodothermales bacterium]